MLLKNYPFELKINTEKRLFEGYASTWDVDMEDDQMMKGCFTKTIDERLPRNKIKILYNHQDAIGLPVRLSEDSKGLFVEGRISKTALGDDVLTLMADKVVDEMSIGFDIIKDRQAEKSIRQILEVKLWEVSPVIFGANPFTSIDNVKRFGDLVSILRHEQQEGRVLPTLNKQKLEEAIDILQSMIASMEVEPDPKSLDVDFHALFKDMREFAGKGR